MGQSLNSRLTKYFKVTLPTARIGPALVVGRGGEGGIPLSHQVIGKILNLSQQNMDLDRKGKNKIVE
jgi:hypothetical protein